MEEFQKSKKYKYIGVVIVILGIISSGIIESTFHNQILTTGITIIFLIAGLIVSSFYKCPKCGKHFDSRTSNSDLLYCPRCGVKLMDSDMISGKPYEGMFRNKDDDMWKY